MTFLVFVSSTYVGHVFCPQVGLKRKEVLALWRNAYSNINFLVPTAIKQRFLVDPSRIAVSKDTKMIVDMWQTPGFEQKEIKDPSIP